MLQAAAPVPGPDRVSLKARVVTAGIWSFSGYGLSLAISFGTNLLLTRLLAPEMFGLTAIAGMVLAGLGMFSDLGLKPNIIRSHRGHEAAFLNTAWAIQIYRGAVIWLIALLVGFLLWIGEHFGFLPSDSAYANPVLPFVVAILAFASVVGGAQSTKIFEASRNLTLGVLTRMEITGQVVGLLCMLAWLLFDRSVWVLVVGGLSSVFTKAALSHIWLPGTRNRWQWDHAAFVEIVHFGKWVFISSILGFLVISGDRLLLGGMVDAAILGVYSTAYLIFNSVEFVIIKIIGDVAFPGLSEVARDRPDNLKATYYRFRTVIASFSYFCAGVLMVSGQALIGLLYDARYHEAGWMLQTLALILMTVPLGIATECFMVLGMPKLLSHIHGIRLVVLFIATPLGFHYFGLTGAIWGIVLSHFSWVPIALFYKAKYSLFDWQRELLLLPVVLIGMGAGEIVKFAIGLIGFR